MDIVYLGMLRLFVYLVGTAVLIGKANYYMRKILTLPTWQIFAGLLLCWLSLGLGFTVAYFFWAFLTYCIYYLGKSLCEKLPAGHDLKMWRFSFHLFSILTGLIIVNIVLDGDYLTNHQNNTVNTSVLYPLIPVELLIVYSIFYVDWFIAKAVATVEKQRTVRFGDYSGDFILLWFPLIGIWWVHPKVRKIFQNG